MRTALLCLAAALAIYIVVRAIAPTALRQNGRPAATDSSHPPTTFGSSAIIPAPRATSEGAQTDGSGQSR